MSSLSDLLFLLGSAARNQFLPIRKGKTNQRMYCIQHMNNLSLYTTSSNSFDPCSPNAYIPMRGFIALVFFNSGKKNNIFKNVCILIRKKKKKKNCPFVCCEGNPSVFEKLLIPDSFIFPDMIYIYKTIGDFFFLNKAGFHHVLYINLENKGKNDSRD